MSLVQQSQRKTSSLLQQRRLSKTFPSFCFASVSSDSTDAQRTWTCVSNKVLSLYICSPQTAENKTSERWKQQEDCESHVESEIVIFFLFVCLRVQLCVLKPENNNVKGQTERFFLPLLLLLKSSKSMGLETGKTERKQSDFKAWRSAPPSLQQQWQHGREEKPSVGNTSVNRLSSI